MPGEAFSQCLVENLSGGDCCCDCDCDCCCDGGKTKSTPSLGFRPRLRLEFDKNNKILLSLWAMYSFAEFTMFDIFLGGSKTSPRCFIAEA